VATLQDVRRIAMALPRTSEAAASYLDSQGIGLGWSGAVTRD